MLLFYPFCVCVCVFVIIESVKYINILSEPGHGTSYNIAYAPSEDAN